MKKKLLILLTLMFFIPFVINAEELQMEWQKSWGGNYSEEFLNVLQTEDGGFIAYGYSYSTDIEGLPNKGDTDVIIVKYDKDWNLLWQKSFGGNNSDELFKLLQTEDGGFIAYGYSYSTDIEGLPNKGDTDAIIIKYDKDGNLLWQKSFGGNSEDKFYELLQTRDGDFIAHGYSFSTDIEGLPNKGSSDAIIIKYDKDGNMLWQKSWGGNKYDDLNNVIETEDGNFILFADSESTDIEGLSNKGSNDAIIVKYDKDGNLLWQKSFGGNNEDHFYKLLQTGDGGFIAYGESYSTDIEGLLNKGDDVIIVKYDKDGNLMWQKSWGGNSIDYFYELLQTEDEGFIAYGNSYSKDIEGLPNKGSQDAIILKYDKDGNLLWQKSFGGNSEDRFYELLQTEDGGFIAYGYSYSTDIEGLPNKGDTDVIIVKYDKDGNLMWQKSWGGNSSEEELLNVLQTEDGGFIAYGNSYSKDIEGLPNKGSQDAIILKYDKDGNLLWQKSWGGNYSEDFLNVLQTEDGGFIAYGHSFSTDIEGLPNKGDCDVIIIKYSINYDIKASESENGTYTVTQQGSKGIITLTPNEGYEVDKIIVKDKDGNVLDVEVNKQEDGTYSFDLYTDVSVVVLFKEKIENPKTGIFDVITIIFVGLVMSLGGFFIVKRYNERLEF